MLSPGQAMEEKIKAGSFQTMGLVPSLVRAVRKKGYRQPTPIQRKCIPPLLQGRDVVGMARTGSGKTAAFVIPIVQRLKIHSARVGIRAVIMSPSRELALQTFSVVRALTKYTDLRAVALIGGDGLEEQFAQLATNPDIVVATPGRFLHLVVEARISLNTVEMVVWDEADRLLEDAVMAQQMRQLMEALPASRQTALFSATMPKDLAATALVSDAAVFRLDTESKLSPDLQTMFIQVQEDAKDALLLRVLRTVKNTVVFCATKHHVEYLQELLQASAIPCVYIYGSCDQTARRLAIEKFRAGSVPILLVTDVAARGIDIPLLDNVINFDFPPTPKLFLHRVGRVARAGRPGSAISFVTSDEMAYLFDLSVFLSSPVVPLDRSCPEMKKLAVAPAPQALIDEEKESLIGTLSTSGALPSLRKVMHNACKLYRKTRPAASPESFRRSKEFSLQHPTLAPHAFFGTDRPSQLDLLAAIKKFKPKSVQVASRPLVKTRTEGNSYKDPNSYLPCRPSSSRDARGYALVSDEPAARKKTSEKRKLSAKTSSSEAYDKWRAKTHIEIQRAGEIENENSQKAQSSLSVQQQKRKWRAKPKKSKARKQA